MLKPLSLFSELGSSSLPVFVFSLLKEYRGKRRERGKAAGDEQERVNGTSNKQYC